MDSAFGCRGERGSDALRRHAAGPLSPRQDPRTTRLPLVTVIAPEGSRPARPSSDGEGLRTNCRKTILLNKISEARVPIEPLEGIYRQAPQGTPGRRRRPVGADLGGVFLPSTRLDGILALSAKYQIAKKKTSRSWSFYGGEGNRTPVRTGDIRTSTGLSGHFSLKRRLGGPAYRHRSGSEECHQAVLNAGMIKH